MSVCVGVGHKVLDGDGWVDFKTEALCCWEGIFGAFIWGNKIQNICLKTRISSSLDPDYRASQTPVTFNQALLLDQSLKIRENSKNNAMYLFIYISNYSPREDRNLIQGLYSKQKNLPENPHHPFAL